MGTDVILTCEGLEIGYNGTAILPAINLSIKSGEFWAVIGRNGSGKTTWFKTLLGLIPPVGGAIRWQRTKIPMAYLPQRSDFDVNYPARARDIVAMGAERGYSFLGPFLSRRLKDNIDKALRDTDAVDLADLPYRALSEGQKQRIMLAKVVAGRPRLALLDEPTAAMDVKAEEETLALIDRLRQQYNISVLIVSHFLGVASRFAEHVLLVDRERQQVRVGPPHEIMEHVDFATQEALAGSVNCVEP